MNDTHANSTFDYIIIGGGSAGCVLAARLSEDPKVTVALLEAGPIDSSVLIHCPMGLALLAQNGQANWKYDTTPQPGLNGLGLVKSLTLSGPPVPCKASPPRSLCSARLK